MAALGSEYTWLFPLSMNLGQFPLDRYLSFTLREPKVIQINKLRSQNKCQTSSISKPNISDIRYDYKICTAVSISKDNEV